MIPNINYFRNSLLQSHLFQSFHPQNVFIMFRKTPSRGYRAPSISSDSGAESPITQLRKEMDDAHENDEAFESSEEDSRPTSDSNMILSEDPFGNEESQRLFESIGMPVTAYSTVMLTSQTNFANAARAKTLISRSLSSSANSLLASLRCCRA